MIIIKKYSNRRLYNTSSSAYVNLQQIADLIREGYRVQVVDAKDGEDLTQQILLQILLDMNGTSDLLPVGLLHRVIRATNDNPTQRLAMRQLATGMQLLEQQLATFEAQMGWTRHDLPPESEPEPEPEAKAEPSRARSKSPRAKGAKKAEATPATPSEEPAEKSVDNELDDLRARLAALEARLTE